MNDTDKTKPSQNRGNGAEAKRAVPAKKNPRRTNSGASSIELSRARRSKSGESRDNAPASAKKTVTAVSEVRKNADPELLKRSEAKVSRPSDKRLKKPAPPQQTVSKKTIEQRREKKIMTGIMAALDENEKTADNTNRTAAPRREGAERAVRKAPPSSVQGAKNVQPSAKTAGQPRRQPRNDHAMSSQRRAAPLSGDKVPAQIPANPRSAERNANTADQSSAEEQAIEKISRNTARANAIVCTAVLFGVGIALIVGPRKSGFINSENRLLAEKPVISAQNVSDGTYFTDLSKWYTDTISVREDLKPFSNSFSKLFGVTLDDVKITGNVSPVKKETLQTSPNTTTTSVTLNTDFKNTTTAAEGSETGTTTASTKKTKKKTEKVKEVEADVNGEWMGSVVVAGKGKNVRAMSGFYGQFDMGALYAQAVNSYKEELDGTNGNRAVNVFTLNMPSSVAYYVPANLADQFTSQHDCITNIGNNLKDVINVDVFDALGAHKDEYIYSRTDHHWQPLGAYYAAKVFAEKAQFDCPDISTYETFKIKDFVGTMYAYSDYDEELNKNPDTFIYHKPDNNDKLEVNYYDRSFGNGQYGGSLFFDYANGVGCYSAILGNDDEIAEIKTDVHNGRTLVIIKDSYGNALVPYLTHGFEKIYVVDFRFFEINAIEFINHVGATDLLFAVSLQAAHTESNITIINNDRIQDGSPASAPAQVIPENNAQGNDGGYDNNNYNDYDNNDQNEGW